MTRAAAVVRAYLRRALDAHTRLLVQNSAWVFIATAIRTVLLFARSVILARTLGAELYGSYALVVAFVGTMQEFFNLNIGTAVIKFGADYLGEARRDKLVALVKASFLASAVFAVLSIGAVYGASVLFYDLFIEVEGLDVYLVLYAVAGCAAFFDYIATSLLRLYYRFRMNSLIQIAVGVLDLAAIAVVAYLRPGDLGALFVAIIAVMALGTVVVNGAALWELRVDLGAHVGAKVRVIREDLRTIAKFVASNSGSRTVSNVSDKGDLLVVGAVAGASEAAYYAIAKKVAFMLNKAILPLVSSVYPQISHMIAQGQLRELKVMLGRVTKAIAVPVLVFLAAGVLFSEPLIVAVYGAAYRPVVPPFLVHMVTVIIGAVFFWSLSFIFSIGRVHFRLVMNLVALAAAVAVAYLLVPAYGAVGVALALLVARTIPTLAFAGVAHRYLGRRLAAG